MPEIRVHRDAFVPEVFEVHRVRTGQTLHAWLIENVPSFDAGRSLPFSAKLNGRQLPQHEFASRHLEEGDALDLTIRPCIPSTATVLASVISSLTVIDVLQIIAATYSVYSYYKLSQQKGYKVAAPNGIYDPNVQANQARLLGVIPEIFGRIPIYPDYLTAPWREYIDNDQYLYLLLNIGVGSFEINSDEIFIGNTPIDRYAGDIDYEIFQPGATVSGNDSHLHIYTTAEVGATQGNAGIEISGPQFTTGTSFSWTFVVSGNVFKMKWKLGEPGSFPKFKKNQYIQIEGTPGSPGANDGLYLITLVSGSTLTVQKYTAVGVIDGTWTGFTPQTDVDATVQNLGKDGDGLWFGPFLATPANEVTSEIALDFLFPEGLVEINAGSNDPQEVKIEVNYRAVGSVAWISQEYTFEDDTLDQLGFTRTISLGSPSYRPEVRVRRLTRDSFGQGHKTKCLWTGLKATLRPATSYADCTTIALRVKGTNAIAGQAENKVNLIATRKLPVLSAGSPTYPATMATREISAALLYVIHDIGLTDADVDMEELQTLNATWNSRGDYFDAVFSSDGTFFESMKQILSPGFAVPLLDFGRISMSRDEIRTTFEHMYQPDNIVGGIQRDFSLIDEDEPDGIEVTYLDVDAKRPATVTALLPGDIGANPQKIDGFGITDRTRAWRFGMRNRRERRYRRTKFSFSTELDALNSRFGSYCALGDDMPNYSQTGRLEAVDGSVLTLSQDVEFSGSPPSTHYIALRKPDGTLSGPYTCIAGEELNQVQLTGSPGLDFEPVLDGSQEPPFFQFGTTLRWTEGVLITELQPEGMERVAVTAVNYDERVYASDDASPP